MRACHAFGVWRLPFGDIKTPSFIFFKSPKIVIAGILLFATHSSILSARLPANITLGSVQHLVPMDVGTGHCLALNTRVQPDEP